MVGNLVSMILDLVNQIQVVVVVIWEKDFLVSKFVDHLDLMELVVD